MQYLLPNNWYDILGTNSNASSISSTLFKNHSTPTINFDDGSFKIYRGFSFPELLLVRNNGSILVLKFISLFFHHFDGTIAMQG